MHKKQASVYAYKGEIDAWWHDGRQRPEQAEQADSLNRYVCGARRDSDLAERPHRATLRASARAFVLIAVIGITAVLFANVHGWRDRLFIHAAKPRIQSLAVLPLESLSRDPEEAHFADGMTDALITDLGKISALRVISRNWVMRFKDAHKPVEEIARELGVDALVEGAVTRSGGRVRITANLVRASPEMHLWAESYERDLREVLALQSDVAEAIAREVQAKLTPSEHARLGSRRMVNADAYELYLKGQYFSAKGTEEGRRKGVRYFEQAIEIDPTNASAYAGIAGAYAPLGYCGFVSPVESDSKTVWAATKALELDDTLSEAHAVLGLRGQFTSGTGQTVSMNFEERSSSIPVMRVPIIFTHRF